MNLLSLNTMILFGDFQTSSITSASSLDEDEAQTVIGHLQEELIALRLRDADTESMVKDLRTKIRELEEVQRLTPPYLTRTVKLIVVNVFYCILIIFGVSFLNLVLFLQSLLHTIHRNYIWAFYAIKKYSNHQKMTYANKIRYRFTPFSQWTFYCWSKKKNHNL